MLIVLCAHMFAPMLANAMDPPKPDEEKRPTVGTISHQKSTYTTRPAPGLSFNNNNIEFCGT